MNQSNSFTARALVEVGVKAIGVGLVVMTVSGIAGWFAARSWVDEGGYVHYSFLSGLYLIFLGALGLACIFNTGLVSGWLAPTFGAQDVVLDAKRFQVVAFSLVGLWLVARSLPYVIQGVLGLLWHLGGERRQYLPDVVGSSAPSYVFSLAQCCIGAAILLRAEQLADLTWRSRPTGKRNGEAG